MSKIEALLQELEQEAQTTRRVLERVPEDRLGWKPHDKSMSLGQLALHVAVVPGAIAEVAGQSPFQLPGFNQPSPKNAAEIMPAFEQSIAKARSVLQQMDDAELGKTWKALNGDQEVMAIPVGALLRIDHAEPLVSPSRSALRLFAAGRRAGTLDLRSERR